MSWAIVVSVHMFSIPSMSQMSSCAVEAGEPAASCSQRGKKKKSSRHDRNGLQRYENSQIIKTPKGKVDYF